MSLSIYYNAESDHNAEIVFRLNEQIIRERFDPTKVTLLPYIINEKGIEYSENSLASILERLNLKIQKLNESNI